MDVSLSKDGMERKIYVGQQRTAEVSEPRGNKIVPGTSAAFVKNDVKVVAWYHPIGHCPGLS